MRLSIRHRLIAVTVLAALACAAALFSIGHLARSGREQRLERARENVLREVERLREASAFGEMLPRGRASATGQSGFLDESMVPMARSRPVGPYARSAILDAAHDASQRLDAVTAEAQAPQAVLVVAVQHVPGVGYAWAVTRVQTPEFAEPWRFGVLVLALATLALVGASLHTLVSFQSGAASLDRSLIALRQDLDAPVEHPSMRELAKVADGIGALAGDLSHANAKHAALSREFAQSERLASLGRVAAGLAHEVRNPLASIKLRVDLAQRTLDAASPLARDLADVSSEVSRLDRLVADLLTVAGRRTGPRREEDLLALVRRRAELLVPWSAERHVSVRCEGESVKANIDADAIGRALDNLLRNAVDASPAGGTVAAHVRAITAATEIMVIDRGPGVPDERVAQLFEPFFTTKPEGTGLGLALSRAIAESHGGSVRYQREQNASYFILTLPNPVPAPVGS